MTFDPSKPVRTRDGRPARIVCTNARGRYPIVALVAAKDGTESPISFTAAGRLVEGDEDGLDLVNIPPEPRSIEETVYLYVDEGGLVWGSTTRLLDTYRKALGSARVTLVEGVWAEETQP